MEEEKKRRPRILKQDGAAPLNQREEHNEDPENQQDRTWTDRDTSQDRNYGRPDHYTNRQDDDQQGWQNRNQGGGGGWQDRNQGGGGGWQDRNQGGGGGWQNRNQGGGGGWQDRNQGGGGGWQNRNQGGGGGWQDRNQGGGGGWQNRNQGGGGGWQDRNQGGGGGWQDRNQGGGGGWQNRNQGGGGWQDRNQGGGGGWQNRNQGGGGGWQDRNQGGGGGWQNRNQGGGGWQDRNQGGGGGGWQNRNQGGGGWQDRNQGGGGGWQDRNQGGGRMQKNFGGGNRKKQFRKQEEFQVQIMPKPDLPSGADMPLNKYLAHCGIASRRKAVEYITTGQVTVNGTVKTEPFYRVHSDDVIMCAGKLLQVQERMVYVLLNKPKGVITTTDDEKGRATVLDIVDPHYPERLFPVGRLDRDTTGLILLTNDGDLAQKLTHPSYNIQKQYRVGLRKPLAQADLELIESGVTLDDGPVEVNWVRFSEDHPKHNVVELEITSGRNRIIRRLFEALDYEIFKLDRFYFAGLTKKDLPRGQFRDLTQREVMMLKHFTGHPGTAKKRRKNDENADADDDSAEFEENTVEMENTEAND